MREKRVKENFRTIFLPIVRRVCMCVWLYVWLLSVAAFRTSVRVCVCTQDAPTIGVRKVEEMFLSGWCVLFPRDLKQTPRPE